MPGESIPQGLWLPPRTATLVVAASNSSDRGRAQADFVCDGVNDHIEIQAALDALPATGGEVFLLDGTYNIEASLALDSYQTLRGCGRNTILTTTTADLDIITATGGDGSEKVGILIADLCVDGQAGGVAGGEGIYLTYVDYSKITNAWLLNNAYGIDLKNSSNNTVTGNTCQGNLIEGIWLYHSNNNTITGNTCQGNNCNGICLYNSNNNTITGNTCQGNGEDGIYLEYSNSNNITGNTCQGNLDGGIWLYHSNNNTITGNTCQGNGEDGIYLDNSNSNNITGNTCIENSQTNDNAYANIWLGSSDYNLIASNLCRAPTIGTTLTTGEAAGATEIHVTAITGFEVGMGVVIDLDGLGGGTEYHHIVAVAAGIITIDAGLTNIQAAGETIDVPEAQYGINISNDTCDKNIIQGNDLHDSGKTANFNDAGTCTIVKSDNREIEITQVKNYAYVKNTSGGDLVAGDVVSYKAVAAGNEVTTPAAGGEDQVFGMLGEDIANNAMGYVQVSGKTVLLKATNAVGGNIGIGDFLCTEIGNRAMKAGAGDMAFAIALEVCAAADVTIDALIVSSLKV